MRNQYSQIMQIVPTQLLARTRDGNPSNDDQTSHYFLSILPDET